MLQVVGGLERLIQWHYGLNKSHKEVFIMKEKNLEDIISNQEQKPEGLTFPCDYPVKAMGNNTNSFLEEMLFIAQKHCTDTKDCDVSCKQSRTGKYQSVTINVHVKSRQQLEDLFADLKQHKDVKWLL